MSYPLTDRLSRTVRWALLVVAISWASPHAIGPLAQPVPAAAQTRSVQATAAPAPTSSLPNDKDSVKFLVIGDSGTGDRAQYDVAAQIARAYTRFKFDFAIMLGDNLYGSESASAYESKFARPYKTLLDAGVKFYAALGNHDEPSQRFYKPFNMDGKRYYTHGKGDVEFFVLDSTYMTPEQIEWLDKELARSNEKWKIPYMHHPKIGRAHV